MKYTLILLLVTLSSWLLTWALRHYALLKGIIDIPNDRSSHTVSTPRGGGVSFIVIFLLSLGILFVIGEIETRFFFAISGGGVIIALIGWIDDHKHVPALFRLIIHFLSATWVVWVLGGGPSILPFDVSGNQATLLAGVITVFMLVWLVNLYNFMDGIDGIASVELVSVCLFAAGLGWITGVSVSVWFLPLLLAASVTGFLLWNFPVARIFMGDAGSGFLGLALGTFALLYSSEMPHLFWIWVILAAVFVVDATVTLLRRIVTGKKFYAAHRSHAYQHAARKYSSHVRVTLFVLIINALWLFPIAYFTAIRTINAGIGVTLAYLPLVVLAFVFRAGLEE